MTAVGEVRRAGKTKLRRGFYSRVLDEAEGLELKVALEVKGLDQEIALLRLTIRRLLEQEPENLELLLRATNTLARLVKSKYGLSTEDNVALKDTILNVLKELAIPLGVKLGERFIGK